MYAEGAVVYPLVAPVEWDAFDMELFLLAGDSEPRARGSRRRLISRMKVRGLAYCQPMYRRKFPNNLSPPKAELVEIV